MRNIAWSFFRFFVEIFLITFLYFEGMASNFIFDTYIVVEVLQRKKKKK